MKWNANVRGLVIFVPKVRGVKRLTVDGIILLGYRIQSEIFSGFVDPRIAAVRGFIEFLDPDFGFCL